MNPFQLFQATRGGRNPKQMIQAMMQGNPQLKEALQGVDFDNPQSMEQVCRNICKQKGIDFDTAMAQFKQQNGGNF